MGAKFAPLMVAGWPVAPLVDKVLMVKGVTGKNATPATREEVKAWGKRWPECNPAIVMPRNVIGLDVDSDSHGEGVDGLEAIRVFEAEFGPLPETGHIFHGYLEDGSPSPYGTYLYRVPDSMLDVYTPEGSPRAPGDFRGVVGVGGVDIIKWWHRYNVAPGAVHSDGSTYEFTPSPSPGTPWLPSPDDLPELSPKHVRALLRKGRKARQQPQEPRGEPTSTQPGKGKALVSADAPEPLRGTESRKKTLLRLVRELAAAEDGQRVMIEGEERGWQVGSGFFTLACAMLREAEDVEKAHRAFLKAGRAAEEAGHDLEHDWESALASVEDEEEVGAYAGDPPYPCAAIQDPPAFAEEFLARNYTQDGVVTLRHADTCYWLWETLPDRSRGADGKVSTFYRALSPEEVSALITRNLRGQRESFAGPEGTDVRPIKVTRRLKSELLGALQDATLVSRHGAGELLDVAGLVPFRNGLLNVRSGDLSPLSPAYDVRWVVPADYAPGSPDDARCPAWFRFLDSIKFEEGTQNRRLLRQWMGYLLSGSTAQHKGLMMVGVPRAGKGTILRVCEAMMGEGATGLDLSAFSTNFGLEPIIGKGLATVDDARFDLKTDKAMVRRLLSLIAEGTISIDRKNKKAISVTAGARLMLATNEVPAIIEASEALSSRFVWLKFTESYLHHEDLGLKDRILGELAEIVKWALGGIADLQKTGYFMETDSGRELQKSMAEISNPIRTFIEEECELNPTAWTPVSELFTEYRLWAETRNYYVGNPSVFSRDLDAAYPENVMFRKVRKFKGNACKGFQGVKTR